MDRSTKERLTGAIVLVAVAWLVIPVFLDGPEEDGETVRQAVDLPGQEGQPTRTRRIVLEPRPGRDEKITDPPPATRQLPAPCGGRGAGDAGQRPRNPGGGVRNRIGAGIRTGAGTRGAGPSLSHARARARARARAAGRSRLVVGGAARQLLERGQRRGPGRRLAR